MSGDSSWDGRGASRKTEVCVQRETEQTSGAVRRLQHLVVREGTPTSNLEPENKYITQAAGRRALRQSWQVAGGRWLGRVAHTDMPRENTSSLVRSSMVMPWLHVRPPSPVTPSCAK